jgi:hypothetical protein
MSRGPARHCIFILAGITCLLPLNKLGGVKKHSVPKTWEDRAIASIEVPLAAAASSPTHISSDYYYRMPVRPIYKSYPIYHPAKEPAGYIGQLQRQEPKAVPSLKTQERGGLDKGWRTGI